MPGLDNTFKLVVTVLRGSHIEEQLKILHQCRWRSAANFVRLLQWLDQTRIEENCKDCCGSFLTLLIPIIGSGANIA